MSRLTTLRLCRRRRSGRRLHGRRHHRVAEDRRRPWPRRRRQFLDSLTPEQRPRPRSPSTATSAMRWHFIPNEMFPRKGLMIKDMNEAQRRLRARPVAQRPERARLRQGHLDHGARRHPQGHRDRRQVRAQQGGISVLDLRHARPRKDTWGWRVEGHHVSVRFTIVDGARHQQRRELADVPRHQSRPKSRTAKRRASACSPTKRMPAARS